MKKPRRNIALLNSLFAVLILFIGMGLGWNGSSYYFGTRVDNLLDTLIEKRCKEDPTGHYVLKYDGKSIKRVSFRNELDSALKDLCLQDSGSLILNYQNGTLKRTWKH